MRGCALRRWPWPAAEYTVHGESSTHADPAMSLFKSSFAVGNWLQHFAFKCWPRSGASKPCDQGASCKCSWEWMLGRPIFG